MQINDVVLGLAAGVGVRLSPDGKVAYYVEWSIGTLSRVEVATRMVTTVMTGLQFPQDVLVDWDDGSIFVSQRTGALTQIFGGGERRDIAKPGYAPHQLALFKKGGKRHLYTVCFDSGRLLQIDLNAGGAIQQICSGLGHPVGLAVDSGNKFAYVTEQDTGALSRVRISNGARDLLHGGMTAPFYLAWDKSGKALYCVQRDPANNLLRFDLGPPVAVSTVQNGLPWRPSGVAPNSDDTRIYVCSDRELEVLSPGGVPPIKAAPPPFEVYSVEFNRRDRPIPIQHHSTGTPVAAPEYIRGSRNEPACYVGGALPRVRVVLRRLPAFVPGTYSIGATGSHGGIRYRDVTPSFNPTGLTNPIDFEFMWPLAPAVARASVSLNWYARRTPGPSQVAAIGSEIHRIFVLLATPTAPWTQASPWVEALDLACGWASGAANADDAARLVTERYNGSGRVSYDTVAGSTMYGFNTFSLSEMIERLTGGIGLGEKVNCTDSANTVSTLANLLGCNLWQSRMASGFDLNPMIPIGYNVWAVPFNGAFSYHEVPWKGVCTQAEHIFDGCLKVDGDADPTTTPHVPLLPINLLFGDCNTMNYRKRLCPPTASGCPQCQPQPGSRQRRPIA